MDYPKCVFCETELKPAMSEAFASVKESECDPFQPWGGGEVQFIFAFGSTKFDDYMGGTVFRGVVCDDCAESKMHLLEKM